MDIIYFDHISGTPIHSSVKEAMVKYIGEGGFYNPSSQHRLGDAAIETLEDARSKVSGLINSKPEEIVFTSGGTESINHAIKGVAFARAKKGRHIITSNIEHQSVSRTLRVLMNMGYQVTAVTVDRYGLVDPSDVKKAIRDDTILVTIMHANNEIGTVEPIAEIGRAVREKGIIMHTDAVVSCGNIPVDVEEMNVDLLSIAANQFYGPPGVGALYIREKTPIYPLIDGGTQENNRRAGTQNMIGIVGMAKAAELARTEMSSRTDHLLGLKRYFLERLKDIDDIVINGHPEKSLPGLVSFSVKYVEGESMMIMLDEKGICVSTRSACASGSLRASHVLIATGSDYATAQGTLLFSFGIDNTKEQIDRAFVALREAIGFLRSISPLYKKK
ncbi:MAG: cysteine desulfurase [Syntrophorhabdaceae bacterium]|nr:cysteine desulfurase [Syntrophorhabdales bacterium]MBP9560452.1 cysteine desulfurase [Syntrophorhabdaceae bacterium]